jgi:hypothetical protein
MEKGTSISEKKGTQISSLFILNDSKEYQYCGSGAFPD